jgi:hypothetical protein
MTKQDMFNAIVEVYSKRMPLYSETIKEGFISKTFLNYDDKGNMAKVKQLAFVEKKNHTEVMQSVPGPWAKVFVSVNYNPIADKLNINELHSGYAYAGRKLKIYPISWKTNLVTYTKEMYLFGGEKKDKPRRFKGYAIPYMPLNAQEAVKCMLNISQDMCPVLPISLKHYVNAESEWDAMESALGYKVSKSLRKLSSKDVYMILNSFANPQDRLRYSLYAGDCSHTPNKELIEQNYYSNGIAYGLLGSMLCVNNLYHHWDVMEWIELKNKTNQKIVIRPMDMKDIISECKTMRQKLYNINHSKVEVVEQELVEV